MAKKNEPSFLISNIRTVFNCLLLSFIEALILQYFNLKYYIRIETDILGYANDNVLSKLAFRIRLNKVVIKIDLD